MACVALSKASLTAGGGAEAAAAGAAAEELPRRHLRYHRQPRQVLCDTCDDIIGIYWYHDIMIS
jgi:hypothetical protein